MRPGRMLVVIISDHLVQKPLSFTQHLEYSRTEPNGDPAEAHLCSQPAPPASCH